MLTIVEHNPKMKPEYKPGVEYPSLAWGGEISVRIQATELEVTGVVTSNGIDRANHDPLWAYMQSMSKVPIGSKRRGTKSPHIKFADADTDEKLIGFVQEFGPVVVESAHFKDREGPVEGSYGIPQIDRLIVAIQDLEELRNERIAYHSALALVSELQQRGGCSIEIIQHHVTEIVEKVSAWPAQWIRERRLRNKRNNRVGTAFEPHWRFQKQNLETLRRLRYEVMHPSSAGKSVDLIMRMDPRRAADWVICDLINAFSPSVYPYANGPVEAPILDIRPGIRPVLYYILRREYLNGGSLGICRNVVCRKLFELERSGNQYCSGKCSLRQRQSEYWIKTGKKRRRKRMKAAKKSKRAQQRKGPGTKKPVSASRKTRTGRGKR
jgi:hypothetical protein